MSLSFEHLKLLRSLHQDLDSLIEELQLNHIDLETALGRIFLFLNEKVNAEILFVETQDENLNNRVFCFGRGNDNIKRNTPQLLKIDRQSSFTTPGLTWWVQPIEMAGTMIGAIGLAYDNENCPDKVVAPEILDCLSEQVDQFFFGIHINRLKHSMIMGIQSALKNHSISDSIDGAVYVLRKEIPFERMIILYSDRELTGEEKINYLVYDQTERVFDSNENLHEGLEEFIKASGNCLTANIEPLKKVIGSDNLTVSYLLDGLIEEDLIGKIIFVPEKGQHFSIFSREIVQVFSESLRQRLVDFNRERNVLRKYFSDDVIRRLTAEPGYYKVYLAPRQAEIGIVFADISGFTKISEQILKDPGRITALVDNWSSGIMDRVFKYGACLDKLVGDCVILLFGPPFYELAPEEIADNLLKSAREIVEFTTEFLNQPENKDIREHKDFEKFGVAIGINFCQAVVGLIGPNDDLTAFSSGMNNTARLQGLAHAGEILVTEKVHELAAKSGSWKFKGPDSAPVKNVEKPLVFYKLID